MCCLILGQGRQSLADNSHPKTPDRECEIRHKAKTQGRTPAYRKISRGTLINAPRCYAFKRIQAHADFHCHTEQDLVFMG